MPGGTRLDELMKMESFDQDFPRFCERHGLPPWSSHRENTTVRKQTLLADSPAAVAGIRRRYADCFSRFGYDPDQVPDV